MLLLVSVGFRSSGCEPFHAKIFTYSAFLSPESDSANSRINIHVHARSLIRGNFERLPFNSGVPLWSPTLHIHDVIARWDCDLIVSIRIRDHTGNFSLTIFS